MFSSRSKATHCKHLFSRNFCSTAGRVRGARRALRPALRRRIQPPAAAGRRSHNVQIPRWTSPSSFHRAKTQRCFRLTQTQVGVFFFFFSQTAGKKTKEAAYRRKKAGGGRDRRREREREERRGGGRRGMKKRKRSPDDERIL